MLSGKRVLVTGATGMNGRYLVPQLVRGGCAVRVLSRDAPAARQVFKDTNVQVVEADLQDSDLRSACDGMDIVIHMASFNPGSKAIDPEQGQQHYQVTVEGTSRLLTAAIDVEMFLFVSSVHAESGDSDYARAKRRAEQLVLSSGAPGRRVSVLRLPPVYGDMSQGMIAAIVRGVDLGKFKILPDFGDRRSLVHLDDVAQAIMLICSKNVADQSVYTVTDGEVYSLLGCYQLACDALGKACDAPRAPPVMLGIIAWLGTWLEKLLRRPMSLTRARLRKMREDAVYDNSRLVRELDFQPGYTLARAMPEIVEIYRGQGTRAVKA